MPATNAEVARLFEEMALLLEIDGANPFRVRAYRNAARTVSDLPHALQAMIEAGEDLTALPGIGADLAGKIETIVRTGRLPDLIRLRKRVPPALADMTRLPGLGPKRVRALHDHLHVRSLKDLEKAARAGRVRGLPGFGPKTERAILAALRRRRRTERRTPLAEAEQVAGPLVRYLEETDGVKDVVVAGSFRRRRETVGDLDILVTCRKGSPVMDRFVRYGAVAQVVSKGPTRSTVRLRSGLQVDVRVLPQVSHGAALHYFTGSKAHNIALRTLAARDGLKVNEYGVFEGKRRVAGRTEEEVYRRVGLPWIPPELREDRGELEAAREGRLPALVTEADIKGDLHVHTVATDGRATIREMAEAARARGYAYLAIADHTRHVTVAHGQDARRLARQMDEIDRLNAALKGIRVLKAAEVDILEDGSLDLPDAVLKDLDFTVCAVHYRFDLPPRRQTERILRAMDNPHFSILAHPTGRLIGEREPYRVEMERLIGGAVERGCHLEVNARPERLDLNDVHCRMAKEAGLKLAISTDAHSVAGLDLMRFGVDQARRGWLEPGDILNTRGWNGLRKLLKRT